ncbi:SRPBCC family protein [Pseudomonas vanderleydeniana]|uniref:SRPBCC family protein n=1 Tax=Pseudomonas vanderleydeniana TaxID=2745495 RepID=A0A9E6PSM7_9PSED|nr:SRPBCC family protein [Pseudomonas vanderleydeniana]QXI31291.1 SRPBCC family protein [Pseudomonas vanderleydeniana]
MAATSVTIEIPASPDQVWQLMGGFGSLSDWLAFIPSTRLSEGGRVRTLQTADGSVVVERLEAFDNRARRYSYSILQAAFPVTDYLATLQVREGSTPQSAIVEWAGIFSPVGVGDEEAVALFHGIYSAGLEALKTHFPG